jgi:hypothetical protein
MLHKQQNGWVVFAIQCFERFTVPLLHAPDVFQILDLIHLFTCPYGRSSPY